MFARAGGVAERIVRRFMPDPFVLVLLLTLAALGLGYARMLAAPDASEGALGKAALAVNLGLIRLAPTVFSYQIFVQAESTPDVDFLVRDAVHRSTKPAAAGSAPA